MATIQQVSSLLPTAAQGLPPHRLTTGAWDGPPLYHSDSRPTEPLGNTATTTSQRRPSNPGSRLQPRPCGPSKARQGGGAGAESRGFRSSPRQGKPPVSAWSVSPFPSRAVPQQSMSPFPNSTQTPPPAVGERLSCVRAPLRPGSSN